MSKHEREQSVFYEPHLQTDRFPVDPSESKAAQILQKNSQGELEKLQQSVFEEVALMPEASSSALPEYFVWRRDQLHPRRALAFLVLIIMCACVFSFLAGIIFSITMAQATGLMAILGPVTIAPPVEEFAKILLPLWLIEQRPWLFRWSWEIPLVCVVGALGFAAIENITYLNIYLDTPGPNITLWRWTICTAVHTAGTSIASIGVVQYWRQRFTASSPGKVASPVQTIGPYLIIAIVLHATYNLSALLYEMVMMR